MVGVGAIVAALLFFVKNVFSYNVNLSKINFFGLLLLVNMARLYIF